MPQLSILLPVFNGETTIRKCIDSVLSQQFEDYELICIDDGSKDNTKAICLEYANKDHRIKVLSKSNGGVASARYAGLTKSCGELVTCVDQDDWIEKNMYNELIYSMKETGADISVGGIFKDKDKDNESLKMSNMDSIPRIICDVNEYIKYAFYREHYRNYTAYVWNKIFSMHIIKTTGIAFDKSIRRGDDVLFFTQYALKSKKCVYDPSNYYHYTINQKSVSNTRNASNIYVLADILKGYEKAIAELEEDIRIKNETTDYLKCFYCYHASRLFDIADREEMEKEKIFFRNKAKKYFDEYIRQNSFDNSRIEHLKSIVRG